MIAAGTAPPVCRDVIGIPDRDFGFRRKVPIEGQNGSVSDCHRQEWRPRGKRSGAIPRQPLALGSRPPRGTERRLHKSNHAATSRSDALERFTVSKRTPNQSISLFQAVSQGQALRACPGKTVTHCSRNCFSTANGSWRAGQSRSGRKSRESDRATARYCPNCRKPSRAPSCRSAAAGRKPHRPPLSCVSRW